MMTPNDVGNRRFSNARFSGYNTDEVNRFMEQVSGDYAALYTENATLKRKMKFLVQKLNEYHAADGKKEEDASQQSYQAAREAADKLLASARAEREAMLAEAKLEAQQIRLDAEQYAETVNASVEEAKERLMGFSAGMRGLVAQQRSCLDQKADEMRSLFAEEQRFLDKQLEFVQMLEQMRPSEEPEQPEAPAQEPDSQEPQSQEDMMRLIDETLSAETAEDDLSPAEPEPSVEEPTQVVDLSEAGDRDYQF